MSTENFFYSLLVSTSPSYKAAEELYSLLPLEGRLKLIKCITFIELNKLVEIIIRHAFMLQIIVLRKKSCMTILLGASRRIRSSVQSPFLATGIYKMRKS
jgi:hypothetical protein